MTNSIAVHNATYVMIFSWLAKYIWKRTVNVTLMQQILIRGCRMITRNTLGPDRRHHQAQTDITPGI